MFSLQPRLCVLAAAASWAAAIPLENCAWTGGTYVIGLLEYYKATKDHGAPDGAALAYVRRWADAWQYKICVGWRQESGCVQLAAGTAFSHIDGTDITGMTMKQIAPLLKPKNSDVDVVVFTIAGPTDSCKQR